VGEVSLPHRVVRISGCPPVLRWECLLMLHWIRGIDDRVCSSRVTVPWCGGAQGPFGPAVGCGFGVT
jgi:hypothetical protein